MEEYKSTREKLVQEFCKKEDLSEPAVDSALKTAVFECVDIRKRRDTDLDVRLGKAIEKLWKFLNLPPEQYECYIKVGGLDTASLPVGFGYVRFVVFNTHQLRKLKKPFRMKHPVDISDKLYAIDTAFKPLLKSPVAIVKVNARDKQAAKVLAERRGPCHYRMLEFLLGHHTRQLYKPVPSHRTKIKQY